MSIDRSKIMTARIIDKEEQKAWFAGFWEDGALRFGVRQQPKGTGDAPRWRWETIPSDEIASTLRVKASIRTALKMRLVDSDDISIQGSWLVEITERDSEGMAKQSNKPTGTETKSLTERISRTFDNIAPRSTVVSGIDGVADWLLDPDGPLSTLKIDGDMSRWTENPLSAVGAKTVTIDPDEKSGIKLSDGSIHVPFEVRPGMTDVEFMLTAYQHKIPMVLFGEPGVGKTHTVMAAFERYGLFAETLGSDTMYSDLVGGWMPDGKGGFVWVDRSLPLSLKANNGRGAPCFYDEITMASPNMLVSVLYDVIVKGYLTLPGNPNHPDLEPIIPPSGYEGYLENCKTKKETPLSEEDWIAQLPKAIFAGPDWYFCAAGNPDVVGAQMSDALLSRLTLKPTYVTNYNTAAELLGEGFEDIVTVARNMEAKRLAGEVSWAPQMRTLVDFGKTARVFGMDVAMANLLAECRLDQDREILEDVLARSTGFTNIKPFTI